MVQAIGYCVLVPMLIALRGYALMINWLWFVVPFGVMALSLPHALGLAALITATTHIPVKSKEKYTFNEGLGISFGTSVCLLGFGWLFHWFMV